MDELRFTVKWVFPSDGHLGKFSYLTHNQAIDLGTVLKDAGWEVQLIEESQTTIDL